MTIKAINKAHQATVNRGFKSYRKYHELVNLDDERNECKQRAAWDKFEECMGALPNRERANFAKQHKTLFGYS